MKGEERGREGKGLAEKSGKEELMKGWRGRQDSPCSVTRLTPTTSYFFHLFLPYKLSSPLPISPDNEMHI